MRTLKVLQEEVKSCTKCGLHATRTNTVFSRGNPQAPLCFVGEAPGEDEDLQGSPFVGRSGKLLDETLAKLGLVPETDIYVCNIIKCRPPNNRRPTEEEVDHCIGYLEQQLQLVSPKVIVALGTTAIDNLLPANTLGITKIHGKIMKYGKIPLIPVYHPSYVLRNGTSGKVFEEFKQDIQLAINHVSKIVPENQQEKAVVDG